MYRIHHFAFVLSFTLVSFSWGQETPVSPKRPNVLVLMTDQHHADWIGCLGKVPVKTPNLDRLAAEGTMFTRSFVPVTFCSPTRAALATACYPSMQGIDRNINDKDDPLRLREPRQTYHHRLAEAGYRNHYLGKWHVGRLEELSCFPEAATDHRESSRLFHGRIQQAGENAYDVGRPAEVEPIDNIFMTKTLAGRHDLFWSEYPKKDGQDIALMGRHRLKAEFHYEFALADYCIELIRRHRSRNEPFAITYSVSPPHPLYAAPAPYYDMYDPEELPLPETWTRCPENQSQTMGARLAQCFGEAGLREFLRCYYAQVTMVDAAVGRILDVLREEGILDDTLILFLSDHGNLNGHHGMIDKTTHAFYDDLCRVPTIVRLPGVFPSEKREDRFVTTMDMGPTILECVGAKPLDHVPGRGFRNMVVGGPSLHEAVFAERGPLPPKEGALFRMIRTEKWKLSLRINGMKELYDLENDPNEITDLSADPGQAAVVEILTEKLVAHMNRIDDPGRFKYKLPGIERKPEKR